MEQTAAPGWVLVTHFKITGYMQPKERVSRSSGDGTRFGKGITAPRTRAHEKTVGWLAKIAHRGQPLIQGPIRLDMAIRFAIPASWPKARREAAATGTMWHATTPDRTNVEKAVEDACNGILWKDDGQICCGLVTKVYHPDPGADVWVYRLEVPQL